MLCELQQDKELPSPMLPAVPLRRVSTLRGASH